MRVGGGCHCGAVRFVIKTPLRVELLDCNCSICRRSGYLHLIVAHRSFALQSGSDQLTSYRFGTKAAQHLFCSVCGIKSFYQPRSHPDSWSVNFTCLDEGHGLVADTTRFDGRNWDEAMAKIGTATDI